MGMFWLYNRVRFRVLEEDLKSSAKCHKMGSIGPKWPQDAQTWTQHNVNVGSKSAPLHIKEKIFQCQ